MRAARIGAKLDLADVASRTRVPLRHLQAIEDGNYGALPAPTYCVGFVKAYARAIGADEVDLARQLREELGHEPSAAHADYYDAEATDPERLPTKTLAWTALALLVLVFAGYGIWRTYAFSPDATEAVENSVEAAASKATATPTAPAVTNPKGQVVLTATDAVWVSIKDAAGTSLIFREMKAGETFLVPTTAVQPKIVTGRPEMLRVTIDGKDVAPLGPPEKTVRNLEVSAAALAARRPPPSWASIRSSARDSSTPISPR